MTDAEGTGLYVRIVDIVGRSALVEYFDDRAFAPIRQRIRRTDCMDKEM